MVLTRRIEVLQISEPICLLHLLLPSNRTSSQIKAHIIAVMVVILISQIDIVVCLKVVICDIFKHEHIYFTN